MKSEIFRRIVEKNKATLTRCRDRTIVLVSDGSVGSVLDDDAMIDKSSSLFEDDSAEILEALLEAGVAETYPFPAVFDFRRAALLFRNSDMPLSARAENALTLSRMNFMGTDGIRGKVVLNADPEKDCIASFLQDNALTPSLVESAAFSFATLCAMQGIRGDETGVVVGNDGRDASWAWRLSFAVKAGFARAGLDVLDIGVVPTAFVPFAMLKKRCRMGAMLTASHNPSNQNGIKFFLDGKKLLPEGPCGDYSLSAHIYCDVRSGRRSISAKVPEKQTSRIGYGNAAQDGAALILSALPSNTAEILRDSILVIDTANGASEETAAKVLDSLGCVWTTRNEKSNGANINKGCGVAEIEGLELFAGNAYDSHIPFIKEMFDKGRMNREGSVCGISLDGDGDRGFLLVYDKTADAVHVVDGDKCGYILARYFVTKNNLDPGKFWFVSTIESDLMTAASAEKNIGLRSKVVSVGDKWIGHFKNGPMLVGIEVSGHVIFPVRFTDDFGNEAELLSGIGLLTGLMTLVAAQELSLSLAEMVHPFVSGFSKTWYTFFVDKTKFYRNSGVWRSDLDIVETAVAALRANHGLPPDIRLVIEDKEDSNVLYISLVNDTGLQGCVFMRNSGTEDKTATYVKGPLEHGRALCEIGRRVQENHIQLLKNKTSTEYAYETAMLRSLDAGSLRDLGDLKADMERNLVSTVHEKDLHNVLHGLRKEGRIITKQNGGSILVVKAPSECV